MKRKEPQFKYTIFHTHTLGKLTLRVTKCWDCSFQEGIEFWVTSFYLPSWDNERENYRNFKKAKCYLHERWYPYITPLSFMQYVQRELCPVFDAYSAKNTVEETWENFKENT